MFKNEPIRKRNDKKNGCLVLRKKSHDEKHLEFTEFVSETTNIQ